MNISTGLRRSTFAAALMLSTALTVIGTSTPASANNMDEFTTSKYTYCDAKLVGALWGMDTYKAKLELGSKIRHGMGGNIPGILAMSRAQGNRCEWGDLGYSYQDAETLANVWGLSPPYNAKLKAAKLATKGKRGLLKQLLGH